MNELTPQQIDQAGQVIVGLIVLAACLIGAAMLLWGKVDEWRDRHNVLSSAAPSEAMQRRPSPQTDGRTDENPRTDGALIPQLAITPERRAGLVALCQVLRAAEINRDEARLLLRGVGLTLSNDVWTDAKPAPAAPPAAPVALTPITQRPYDPTLYHQDDPALQYVAPEA